MATFALFVASLATERRAAAHEAGLSRGDYAVEGAVVTATLTFAARDVAYAIRTLDVNRDGLLSAGELEAARVTLDAAFAKRLVIQGDAAQCASTLAEAAPFENDAVRLVVRATCGGAPRRVHVDVGLLAVLPFGHRHLAHAGGAVAGDGADALLTLSRRTFSFAPAPAVASSAPAPAPGAAPFLRMGLEHILTGWDHLAFLLGLAIVGGRPRALLIVVTAFTLGHSVSLAIATLGVWVPSARVVEPLIAASIVFVGVENLARRGAARGEAEASAFSAKRWRVTLPFGLVHGFGFASALREAAVPRPQLPWALLLFNLGVELGQVLALALAWPLLVAAHRRAWFRDRGAGAVSLAIAVAGLAWLVQRLFFA